MGNLVTNLMTKTCVHDHILEHFKQKYSKIYSKNSNSDHTAVRSSWPLNIFCNQQKFGTQSENGDE